MSDTHPHQGDDPIAPTVLHALREQPTTAPIISELTGLPAAIVRSALYRLEKRGVVKRAGTTPATNARGKAVGGPRAVVWSRA